MSSIYIDRGYHSRHDYLRSLAMDYDVPVGIVIATAAIFGPSEDFDGLVNAVVDYAGCDGEGLLEDLE